MTSDEPRAHSEPEHPEPARPEHPEPGHPEPGRPAGPEQREGARPRAGRAVFWLILAIAAVVILADQGSKWWAESALADGRSVPVVGDLIRFVLVYNPGAAFSIGTGFTWIFALVAAAAAVFIVWFSWRVTSRGWMIALGLILGGALTHLGDRLFRAPGFGRGHVVDFIAYGDWFVGNVADIAIVVGAVLAFVLALLGVRTRRIP